MARAKRELWRGTIESQPDSAMWLNELAIQFDRDQFFCRYEVYRVEKTSGEYFSFSSILLDAPLLAGAVLSTYYDSGSKFYVLMEKSTYGGNERNLAKVFRNMPDADSIQVSLVTVQDFIKYERDADEDFERNLEGPEKNNQIDPVRII